MKFENCGGFFGAAFGVPGADRRCFGRRLPLLLLLLVGMALGGCVKNEFKIEAQLPAEVNTTVKIVYYASDPKGGFTVETALAVAGGKAELKGVTRNPTVGWIFQGKGVLPAALFYAERGDVVKISGSSANPSEWKISGNKVNDLLTEWVNENSKLLSKSIFPASGGGGASSSGAGSAAAGAGSGRGAASASVGAGVSASAGGVVGMDVNNKALNESVAKFVKAHPDSEASAILLTAYYDSRQDAKGFTQLWKILSESGVAEKLGDLNWRQDLTGDEGRYDLHVGGKAEDIVVQSYWRNIDTLKLLSGGKKSFLAIWDRDDAVRKQPMLDTLRRLVRQSGDSSTRLIADLCLSRDSSGWAMDVKRDSLRQTVRAFTLVGRADKNVLKLGAQRLPWYVVTSPQGKILYIGGDISKAVKAF